MNDLFLDNWATQLRKGVLELCILSAIRGRRIYGYEIVRQLRMIDGLMISEGTVYPILSRLRREGLLASSIEESSEGPPRKYYQLTDAGEAALARMNEHWLSVHRGIQSLRGESKP